MMLNKPNHLLGLAGWVVICFAASAVGAAATVQAKSFYGELAQPVWAPPPWLFGPVWTVLYAMMAVAAWLVWRSGGFKGNRIALSVFLVQLCLNGLWSWVFFSWQDGVGAIVNIAVLWVLIVLTVVLFWRVRPIAGLLLVPYLAWVSFATALTIALSKMNPGVLG